MRTGHLTQVRSKHYNFASLAKLKTRRDQGLTGNPNAAGVLTDSPDFSYLDGRLTPLGQGQNRRLARNEQAKQQIILLAGEIDFAIERYNKMQKGEQDRKQEILDRKLKPKGETLIGSN